MVHGVTSSAVDDFGVHGVFAVMDQHCPDVHHHEQANVGKLLQRKNEGEDVVRYALRKTVQWMESVAGEGRGNDPFVMRLMKLLVDEGVMQATVNPVDERVCKKEEERELENVVPPPWSLGGCVINLGIAAYFGEEGRGSAERHERQSFYCLHNLHRNLVLEVAWVVELGLVKDENVRQRREQEVRNTPE